MKENFIKIHLKMSKIEFEYEGDNSFLKNELSSFLKEMSAHNDSLLANLPKDSEDIPDSETTGTKADISIATIASRIGVGKAPDLIIAAAVYLTFVAGKEKFSRKDLLETMKGATAYYKRSILSNLSSNLARLVANKRLNETSSGTYALTSTERDAAKRLFD